MPWSVRELPWSMCRSSPRTKLSATKAGMGRPGSTDRRLRREASFGIERSSGKPPYCARGAVRNPVGRCGVRHLRLPRRAAVASQTAPSAGWGWAPLQPRFLSLAVVAPSLPRRRGRAVWSLQSVHGRDLRSLGKRALDATFVGSATGQQRSAREPRGQPDVLASKPGYPLTIVGSSETMVTARRPAPLGESSCRALID